MGGVWGTEFNIVFNRVREQIHILEYHADILHQAVQLVIFYINAADADITDTTVTATPLNLGACIISRRTGKDGETCYLQTHRTSGTFCRYHIPTSPYAEHIKRHGLPCTAITPYIIHL